MSEEAQRPPVQVGERAPDFLLPGCNRPESLALSDFRGRSSVLLALDRGIYCPFCRRHLVQLGATSEKLREHNVETIVVVAAPTEHARLYLKARPTRVAVAADDARDTHRSFGLPNPPVTPELVQALQSVKVNPTGELPAPVPIAELNQAVNQLDKFQLSDSDRDALHKHMHSNVVIVGQFLIDREGIVRWRNVECEKDGLEGAAKFPSDEEFLVAARAL